MPDPTDRAIIQAIQLNKLYGWSQYQIVGSRESGFSLLGAIIQSSPDGHVRLSVLDRIKHTYTNIISLTEFNELSTKEKVIELLELSLKNNSFSPCNPSVN